MYVDLNDMRISNLVAASAEYIAAPKGNVFFLGYSVKKETAHWALASDISGTPAWSDDILLVGVIETGLGFTEQETRQLFSDRVYYACLKEGVLPASASA